MVPWQLFDFLTEEQVKPLKILIMAHKKFWENATYVALAAVTIILMMVSVIIANPIVVWVLALIAPQWVARMSYKDGSGALGAVVHLPFWANRWMWRVLPWRSRKCYMRYDFENFSKFSSRCRKKYFLESYLFGELAEADKVFAKLYADEKAEIFEKYKDSVVDYVIEKGEDLSDEQFAQLDYVQIRKYAQKHNGLNLKEFELLASEGKNKGAAETLRWLVYHYTPSFEQIKILAQNNLDDILQKVLMEYGLEKSKVVWLKKLIADDKRWKKMSNALHWYSQILVLKSKDYTLEDWRELCAAEEICGEAQCALNEAQYEVFHAAGQHLSDEAVIVLLQNRNISFAKKIFEFEPNNGLTSEDAKAIVEADPQLKLALYEVRAKEANK